jgi:hypothetical protein
MFCKIIVYSGNENPQTLKVQDAVDTSLISQTNNIYQVFMNSPWSLSVVPFLVPSKEEPQTESNPVEEPLPRLGDRSLCGIDYYSISYVDPIFKNGYN